MAREKIGLEAVLEMGGFTRAANKYQQILAQMGKAGEKLGVSAKTTTKFIDTMIPVIGGAGIAAIGAQKAFQALAKVFEFGKQGAVVWQTKDSFDRLMDSMGVAPNILGQMRVATLGTVDDMTLMSSTMTLLAGTSDTLGRAMAENAPRLLEIAKAANKLNPTLGDTSFLYQSLATGIKRSSPLILDNLGLTLKIGAANEAYAKTIGKTVEEMSAEDKQMALLTATLEAGNRMIEQAGGSTESMADAFAQAEVDIKNASDAIKMQFAPAIADALGGVSKFITETLSGFELLGAVLGGELSLGDWLEAGAKANKLYAEEGAAAMREYVSTVIQAGGVLEAQMLMRQRAQEQFAGTLEPWKNGIYGVDEAQEELILSSKELDDAQKKLESTIKDIQKAYADTLGTLATGIINWRKLGETQAQTAKDYQQSIASLRSQAAQDLKAVQEDFAASLPDKTSVAERMQMAGDAWDEWALRLDAIMEGGVSSPWYAMLQEMGYSKPPDVGMDAWISDLKDKFYKGQLPDLLPPEWAEKVRQQQEEATRAVEAENAKRLAAAKKAREEQLKAEQEARNQMLIELALDLAESTNQLQAWSEQKFGPDFSGVADTADEVLALLQSGMLELDGDLQAIISNVTAGIQTSLDETGAAAEENKAILDEIVSTDFVAEKQAQLEKALNLDNIKAPFNATAEELGFSIEDNIPETPFDPLLDNFEGASQSIWDEALALNLQLSDEFEDIDTKWAATVLSQVQTWDEGMSEVQKAIKEKVIDQLDAIPKYIKIVVETTTTEVEGGGMQAGGPVAADTAYIVGEAGPELFIPGVAGTIIPNADAGLMMASPAAGNLNALADAAANLASVIGGQFATALLKASANMDLMLGAGSELKKKIEELKAAMADATGPYNLELKKVAEQLDGINEEIAEIEAELADPSAHKETERLEATLNWLLAQRSRLLSDQEKLLAGSASVAAKYKEEIKAYRLELAALLKLQRLLDKVDIGRTLGNVASFFANLYTEQVLKPIQSQIDELDAAIAEYQMLLGATEDAAAKERQSQLDALDTQIKWYRDIGSPSALKEAARLEQERAVLLAQYSAELAKLETERAEAAAQYAAEQERILRLQEKQRQLDLLGQQVELLKLIQDYGLDAGTLLGGLELGLGASTEDMIDAMTAAMGAVVSALNRQIVGYQHGGMVAGGRAILVGEAGPELFLPARPGGLILPNSLTQWGMNLPASSGAGGGGMTVGNTVNLTINPTINNQMDMAEFQALTLQTVQRAVRGI